MFCVVDEIFLLQFNLLLLYDVPRFLLQVLADLLRSLSASAAGLPLLSVHPFRFPLLRTHRA